MSKRNLDNLQFKWEENDIKIEDATSVRPRIQRAFSFYNKVAGINEPSYIYQADWLEKRNGKLIQKMISMVEPIR